MPKGKQGKKSKWIIEWFTYNDNLLASNVVNFIVSFPHHMWSLAKKNGKKKCQWTSN
jgi:hypothetical protein